MNLSEYVEKFKANLDGAIESIECAANCYVSAVREFGDKAQEAFRAAYPHVTENTWCKFVAIGNGDLNPAVMLLSDKFSAKIARMPKVKQDEVLNGDSFDVFSPTTRKVEKIAYAQLKPRHEAIVFDEATNNVRTIPEQVAYCDLVAAKRKAVRNSYTIHTDFLEVHFACRIGRKELEEILLEMA